MIRQTSLLAYADAKEGLGDKQKQVLEAIMTLGKCYDKQIADFLGWEINRITPRRKELFEAGKIESTELLKNKQGRSVQGWQFKATI